MGNRIIYFVRHGQYTKTTKEGEEPDGSLTELGQKQAEHTAKRLESIPFVIIHHSTLIRATETAVIIAQQLPDIPLKPSDTLRECIPCVPNGYEQYFTNIPQVEIDKGNKRARTAFTTYIQPLSQEITEDRYELIVAHGNLINYLIGQTIHAPEESWLFTDIENGAISQVTIFPSGVKKLTRHNDIGHFPPHLITTS